MTNKFNTLLLSSGGIKGYSFLGVWKYIQEKKLKITTFSGVSIGALFSMWFALGFTFNEIYSIITEIELLDLFHFDFTNFFDSYGMINIRPFKNFIIKKMEEKGYDKDLTFKELYEQTHNELHSYAYCINDHRLVRFDKDNTPDCSIRKAVLMSMSIPLIFKPVEYKGKLYVDGALEDSFPIHDYDIETLIPCFVMNETSNEIENIFHYTFKIVRSVLKQKMLSNYNVCFIHPKVGTLDITLDINEITNIINIGYDSITKWIEEDLS